MGGNGTLRLKRAGNIKTASQASSAAQGAPSKGLDSIEGEWGTVHGKEGISGRNSKGLMSDNCGSRIWPLLIRLLIRWGGKRGKNPQKNKKWEGPTPLNPDMGELVN